MKGWCSYSKPSPEVTQRRLSKTVSVIKNTLCSLQSKVKEKTGFSWGEKVLKWSELSRFCWKDCFQGSSLVHVQIPILYISFHCHSKPACLSFSYNTKGDILKYLSVFFSLSTYNVKSQWGPGMFGPQCSLKYLYFLQNKVSRKRLKWREGE